MMPNTRRFCDEEENDHAMVPPMVEVRDCLGVLAVQVLSAKEDLARMDAVEMVSKLHGLVCELHQAYSDLRTHLQF